MADLLQLKDLLMPEFRGMLHDELKPIDKKIDKVINILDGHTAILERHDQELLVLSAQQEKTTQVLVKKGVAPPEELAV